ncbi:unnamed protein product [Nippostrongylus brasiliensis]|uniref:Secreted protein n=1 Tax=Nippostrongylus brasiliensis TaxID=27835 RepID=A0A0N4Y8R3_NIPBR|nr:hypothetical protein Q1695_004336 [Nippostrongylus brasiliensis]VDL76224.1 unnamed protein product [Nippostrongylus brasiliensis]
MIGVRALFIVASVQYISDAAQELSDFAQEQQGPTPTLEEIIVNATRANNESMSLLERAFGVRSLLTQANRELNRVLDQNDTRLLKGALDRETRALSLVMTYCRLQWCREGGRKVAGTTIAIAKAIRMTCGSESTKNKMNALFSKVFDKDSVAYGEANFERMAWRLGSGMIPLSHKC